jgi:hypothetical protein
MRKKKLAAVLAIALERAESIYGQVHYNRVAIGFLSPSIDLCGVRVGCDKLTHLFSNGFFYYDASRQKGPGPRSAGTTGGDPSLRPSPLS